MMHRPMSSISCVPNYNCASEQGRHFCQIAFFCNKSTWQTYLSQVNQIWVYCVRAFMTYSYVLLWKGLSIRNLNTYTCLLSHLAKVLLVFDSRYVVATSRLHPLCKAHFSLPKPNPATMLLSQHSASFKRPCWRPDKQTSSQTYYIYSLGGIKQGYMTFWTIPRTWVNV